MHVIPPDDELFPVRHALSREEEGEVSRALYRKRVLVTGAAGSIGSALLASLRKYEPAVVIGFDLVDGFDVRDALQVRAALRNYSPDIVVHAAALKHVPDLEEQPLEAVQTNIFGTQNLLQSAEEAQVKRFLFLSTDKAVEPSSVMGATKRVCEMLLQNYSGPVSCLAVRFGNVAGSQGSVLPIFRRQIASNEPLTVTDAQMTRFFLSIEDAVATLLRALILPFANAVAVPEMGDPVSIRKLAETLAAGRPIVFTGRRAGEKLVEELWDTRNETAVGSVGGLRLYRYRTLIAMEDFFARLHELTCTRQAEAVLKLLQSYPGRERVVSTGTSMTSWSEKSPFFVS